MIFVTVGTHEQPFDRLIKEIDRLKEKKIIRDEVFIQTGYSNYKPIYCQYKEFIKFNDMMSRMKKAKILITHGGTGSIMLGLYHQKIPIVMPRKKKYLEHIDDHQVLFCRTMESKRKILAVYEIDDLKTTLLNYSTLLQNIKKEYKENVISEVGELKFSDKADRFADKLQEICLHLLDMKT